MPTRRYLVVLITIGAIAYIIVSVLKEPGINFVRPGYQADYQKCIEIPNNKEVNNKTSNSRHEDEYTRTAIWRRVSEKHRMFVYSAFHDYRLPDRIRLIGVMPNGNSYRPWCEYKVDNSMCRSRVHIANINESHHKKFTAVFFLCYLCTVTTVPPAVAIFENENNQERVKVHMVTNQTYDNNFSVCVAPLFGQYNDVSQLIEWVELNIMYGVTHFTFYDLSTSNTVAQVLDYYKAMGVAEVFTWNIDIVHCSLRFKDDYLHYFGQLAAINDCLYRQKSVSKYVAIIDLDELIVPRNNEDYTWGDMFNKLPKVSEYMFRMAMFRTQFNVSAIATKHLRTLTMKYRDDIIYPGYHRSKVIVRTSDAAVLGVHNTWGIRDPGYRHIVNTSIGALHHYRNTPTSDFKTEIRVVEDVTMNKYKQIISRYNAVIRNMKAAGIQIGPNISDDSFQF